MQEALADWLELPPIQEATELTEVIPVLELTLPPSEEEEPQVAKAAPILSAAEGVVFSELQMAQRRGPVAEGREITAPPTSSVVKALALVEAVTAPVRALEEMVARRRLEAQVAVEEEDSPQLRRRWREGMGGALQALPGRQVALVTEQQAPLLRAYMLAEVPEAEAEAQQLAMEVQAALADWAQAVGAVEQLRMESEVLALAATVATENAL